MPLVLGGFSGRFFARRYSHSYKLCCGEGGGVYVGHLEHRYMDVSHDEPLPSLSQTIL